MQQHHASKETSLCLTLYRVVWLAVFVTFILAACSWADRHMKGVPPEHQEVQP